MNNKKTILGTAVAASLLLATSMGTVMAQDTAATVKEKAPEVASSVKGSVGDAADSAKERLGGGDEKKSEGASSSDSAAAGGDAQVGDDKPLSS